MKILALLDVDEKELAKTGFSFTHEMGWVKESGITLKKYKKVKDNSEEFTDLAQIHTQGLKEGIRCALYTNYYKSDTGCDNNCCVNENLYNKVINVVNRQII